MQSAVTTKFYIDTTNQKCFIKYSSVQK